MKEIFRSILNFKKGTTPTIPLNELVKNYREFLMSKVECEDPSYIKMYEWIESHYRGFKEIPSFELLFEKAEREGEETIVVNLKEMVSLVPYWGGDYKAILKTKFNEQNQDAFRSLVEKTWQVAFSGMKKKGKGKGKKELKGITDAISYFSSTAREFLINSVDVRTEGDIRDIQETEQAVADYQKKKKDPFSNIGLYTDLSKIDEVFRGIKLGDLFIIAAFASQGKSTMAVNLGYNGISQGLNGLFITLEMTYEEMRDMIYVLHTSNHEWYDNPKFSKMVGNLSYEKVRYAELSKEEEKFYNTALKDFSSRDDFGKFRIIQSSGLTPSRLEMEVDNYKTYLEEKGKDLDFLVVDYVGLMNQDKELRYGDFNIDLNNIIKRLKIFTLSYNNGRGLRVITPFQINREGFKEAMKNDGMYKLTALSNANEAERSSDGVITLFANEEMKKTGRVKIGCLKNRDGRLFSPFEANIDFSSKWMRDFARKRSDAPEDAMAINPIDNISDDITL
jgi:KaiC/GvpD/RAD55 family RecA-like ATPase